MTDAQYAQILAVVGLANETKRLAIGYQVPIDDSLRSRAKCLKADKEIERDSR